MANIFGTGDVSRESQIRDLQKQVDQLKHKLDDKDNENLPAKYRLAQAALGEATVLYEWEAPSRVRVNRGRQWYWTVALVVMAIIVILAFFQELALIGAVIAFMFVLYVAATVPPGDVKYKLTEHGVEVGEGENAIALTWDQLTEFWFSFRQGREILNVDTGVSFPTRLMMLFEEDDRRKLVKILEEKLPYKPMPRRKQGFVDRLSDGIYIPYQEVKSPGVASRSESPTISRTKDLQQGVKPKAQKPRPATASAK